MMEPPALSQLNKDKLLKNPADARRKLLPVLLQTQGTLRNLNQEALEQKNTAVRSAVLKDYRRMVERPKRWQKRCRSRGQRFLKQYTNDAATACEDKSTASIISDSCSQASKDSFISWFDDLLTQDGSMEGLSQTQKDTCTRLYQGGSSLSLFPLLKCRGKREEEDISSTHPQDHEEERKRSDRFLVDYRQEKISKSEQRKSAKLFQKANFVGYAYDAANVLPIKPFENTECCVRLKPGVYFHVALASIHKVLKNVRIPATLLLGLEDVVRGESNPVKACLTSQSTKNASFVTDPSEMVVVQDQAIDAIVVKPQHNKLPIAVCKRACALTGGSSRSVISFIYDEDKLREEVKKAWSENTPVAFQRFVKAKGGRPWILRMDWKRKLGCVKAWMLTSTASFPTIDDGELRISDYKLSTCSSRLERCSIVPLRPSRWKEPCLLTEELASALYKVHCLPLVELAVDFVQDENNIWWVLQVKAFGLDSEEMQPRSKNTGASVLVPKKKPRVQLPKPPIMAPVDPVPTCKGSHCISPEARMNPSATVPYRHILLQRAHAALGLYGKVRAETLEELFNSREQREQFNNVPVCQTCHEVYRHVPQDLLSGETSRAPGKSSRRSDAACARLYDNHRKSMRKKTEPILKMLREEDEEDKARARRRRAKVIKSRKKRHVHPFRKEKATFYDLHAGDRVVLVDTSNAGTVVRCDEDNSRVTVKFDDGFTVNRIERSLLICKEKHLTNDFKLSADELISVGAVPPTSTYEFNRDQSNQDISESDSDYSVTSPRADYAEEELRMVDEDYILANNPYSRRKPENTQGPGICCPFGCGLRLKPDSHSLTDAHKTWKAHMEMCSNKYTKRS